MWTIYFENFSGIPSPEKPDALYAATITGTVAILVLFLTNAASNRRQKLDASNRLNERVSERAYNLKKELYLDLIKARQEAEEDLMKMLSHDPVDMRLLNVTSKVIQCRDRLLVAAPELLYSAVFDYCSRLGEAEVNTGKLRVGMESSAFQIFRMKERRRAILDELIQLKRQLIPVVEVEPTTEDKGIFLEIQKRELEKKELTRLIETLKPQRDEKLTLVRDELTRHLEPIRKAWLAVIAGIRKDLGFAE